MLAFAKFGPLALRGTACSWPRRDLLVWLAAGAARSRTATASSLAPLVVAGSGAARAIAFFAAGPDGRQREDVTRGPARAAGHGPREALPGAEAVHGLHGAHAGLSRRPRAPGGMLVACQWTKFRGADITITVKPEAGRVPVRRRRPAEAAARHGAVAGVAGRNSPAAVLQLTPDSEAIAAAVTASMSAAGRDVLRAALPSARPAPPRAARAGRGRASRRRSRARAVAERDRARLAAVLAADPDLDRRASSPGRARRRSASGRRRRPSSISNGLRSSTPSSR